MGYIGRLLFDEVSVEGEGTTLTILHILFQLEYYHNVLYLHRCRIGARIVLAGRARCGR